MKAIQELEQKSQILSNGIEMLTNRIKANDNLIQEREALIQKKAQVDKLIGELESLDLDTVVHTPVKISIAKGGKKPVFFSEDIKEKIREQFRSGKVKQAELAAIYGCRHQYISKIVAGIVPENLSEDLKESMERVLCHRRYLSPGTATVPNRGTEACTDRERSSGVYRLV
jgi:hypothetical protein